MVCLEFRTLGALRALRDHHYSVLVRHDTSLNTTAASAIVVDDPCIINNRLASYVPALRDEYDHIFRLRVVLHGFGTVWSGATAVEQQVLVEEEPEPFEPFWDAFLAAWVEYLCGCEGLEMPGWAQEPKRYLPKMHWAADYFRFERGWVIVTTPPVFEAHGIWIPDNELLIV